MRPSSKTGTKATTPAEMFSNSGVIEFRTGVVVTSPVPETVVGPVDSVDDRVDHVDRVEADGTDVCSCVDDVHPTGNDYNTVKNAVFTAVKAAVMAQKKETVITNAMRSEVASDAHVRRIVKQEVLGHQIDARTSALQADMRMNAERDAAIRSDMRASAMQRMNSVRTNSDMRASGMPTRGLTADSAMRMNSMPTRGLTADSAMRMNSMPTRGLTADSAMRMNSMPTRGLTADSAMRMNSMPTRGLTDDSAMHSSHMMDGYRRPHLRGDISTRDALQAMRADRAKHDHDRAKHDHYHDTHSYAPPYHPRAFRASNIDTMMR
jgi:hypothetical protein